MVVSVIWLKCTKAPYLWIILRDEELSSDLAYNINLYTLHGSSK